MQYNPNNGSPLFACYSSASQQAIAIYSLTATSGVEGDGETPEPEVPTGPVKDGDKVVIYAPAYNKALSATKTGNYNVGVDVTATGDTFQPMLWLSLMALTTAAGAVMLLRRKEQQ